MSSRRSCPGRLAARGFAGLAAVAMLFAVVSPPAQAAASAAQPRQGAGPCPRSNTLGNFQTDTDVGATYRVSGLTASYTFSSFTDRHPVNGVPGLLDYCVYPSSAPEATTVVAHGANGALWRAAVGFDNFAFQRPDGNPSNIPLNGDGATAMGSATWPVSLPQQQLLLLHINDAAACTRIYGGNPGTCFVKPGPKPAPVCDRGVTTIAYNAMPIDVVDCYRASLGFEANSINEFGDGVGLAGTSRQLGTLRVMFASFACQTGSAFSSCQSAPGATFQHPITANIYGLGNLTTPIATLTQTVTFPYRPSSDPTNCPSAPAQWYNPDSAKCQYSIGTVVTFDFSSLARTLPDQVVWTVAYNTSHSGYHPLGTQPCSSGPGGCPYDALNVGATSFPGAPYAGTDLDSDIAYLSTGNGTLQPESGWSPFRPLGAITTH